ncbi:HAMP domain-containing sensor histidine kinase [Arthrobacter sp. Br18]|uniref:sensor histidine kinase n=1 Tax=Arthrobacter sp. Br18 TaxID=1312954 RepID=UPI0004B7E922|nr:HAMP domain-containing sensor histidine kinase [Arthrobacter sp. Br18]
MGLSQFPLTMILVCLALAAPAAWPGLLGEGLFQAALLIHALLFLLCWIVPWERLPPVATLSIPLGDMVAIVLSRNGALDYLPGLGILLIFPVIWLAASGRFPTSTVLASFLVPLGMGLVPLLRAPAEATATQLTSTVLLALMLLAVASAVRFVTATMALQQRKLERKDTDLRRLLESSERRESLLKTILDTIDVGVSAVDTTGSVTLRNHQQEIFDRTGVSGDHLAVDGPGAPLYGQDRKTRLPADKVPVVRATKGETFADYLVWIGDGAGARALSTAARAVNDEAGDFAGAVVASNDVTSLVEAITAKDEVIATVSHELRTPLTSVLGNLEFALSEKDPEVSAHYVEIAHRNAERLMELVADLLLSSSAAMTVHPRETDIAGLIDSVVGSVAPQAAAAGIEIKTDVPAPLWTHTDPLRMSQVLDNLLSNAIKYTSTGGMVAVRARTEGGQLRLDVRDTGVGMSPPDAARVFDRFFRTSSARTSAIPGTGLGLSIAKAIVEGHHGRISCVSAPGKGSTFSVSLPHIAS